MTMKETMQAELEEAIRSLEKANSAFSRLFGEQEEEGEE